MNLKLIEPFRELFKDEVRAISHELGLSDDLIWWHPLPGSGLAVRVLGEINRVVYNVRSKPPATY